MNKKKTSLLLIATTTFMILASACGNNQELSEQTDISLSDADVQVSGAAQDVAIKAPDIQAVDDKIIYEGVTLSLDMTLDEVTSILGEPISVYHGIDENENYADNRYDDFLIGFEKVDGTFKVAYISVDTEIPSTSKGITLKSAVDDIKKAYGEPTEEIISGDGNGVCDTDEIIYTYEDFTLYFSYFNGQMSLMDVSKNGSALE